MTRTMGVVSGTLLLAALLAGPAFSQDAPAATAPGAAPAVTAPRPEAFFTLEPVSGDYEYREAGRKDPFDSLLRLKEIEVDLTKLPEIQRLETSTLQLRGIAVLPGRPSLASVFDPATKKYYTIYEGDLVGRNQGVVTSITADGIVIEEKFKDFLGKITTRDVVLVTNKPVRIDTKGGTP